MVGIRENRLGIIFRSFYLYFIFFLFPFYYTLSFSTLHEVCLCCFMLLAFFNTTRKTIPPCFPLAFPFNRKASQNFSYKVILSHKNGCIIWNPRKLFDRKGTKIKNRKIFKLARLPSILVQNIKRKLTATFRLFSFSVLQCFTPQ